MIFRDMGRTFGNSVISDPPITGIVGLDFIYSEMQIPYQGPLQGCLGSQPLCAQQVLCACL